MEAPMNRIFTIPNLLSLIRILLIPVFVALFFHDEMIWAALILIISGLTDTLDGYIARHFNMITNLGKVLDPIADKLTQAVVAFCLCVKMPAVIPLFVLVAQASPLAPIGGGKYLRPSIILRSPFWFCLVNVYLNWSSIY